MELVLRPWIASHEESQGRLSALLEGTLRRRESRRVLRHLARCETCREAMRTLARTVDGLRSLGRREPPPGPSVADSVVERIRHEDA